MFLHNLRAYEQGQICIYGFMSEMCPGKKFWRFYNHTSAVKKLDHNRFSVLIHFATNRFTFEKIPPPPPLIHSSGCQTGGAGSFPRTTREVFGGTKIQVFGVKYLNFGATFLSFGAIYFNFDTIYLNFGAIYLIFGTKIENRVFSKGVGRGGWVGPPRPPGGLGIGVGKKYSAHHCVRLREASRGPEGRIWWMIFPKKFPWGAVLKVRSHLKITRVSLCRLILNEINMFLVRHIIYQKKLNDIKFFLYDM